MNTFAAARARDPVRKCKPSPGTAGAKKPETQPNKRFVQKHLFADLTN